MTAVGLIKLFMVKSSNKLPVYFIKFNFNQSNLPSRGKLNKLLVQITPDIFIYGFNWVNINELKAPKQCPYKNKGMELEAYDIREPISLNNTENDANPRGPPE